MTDAEQLRYLVLAVQREGNRRLAVAFATIGLTRSQAEVVRVLDQAGRISLRRLGELLVCESGTNPSRLVDRLVASGHVDRTPSGDDRGRLPRRYGTHRTREARLTAAANPRGC